MVNILIVKKIEVGFQSYQHRSSYFITSRLTTATLLEKLARKIIKVSTDSELRAETGSACVSYYPKADLSFISVLIEFFHSGRRPNSGKFV